MVTVTVTAASWGQYSGTNGAPGKTSFSTSDLKKRKEKKRERVHE
jgi:hypothetical protein